MSSCIYVRAICILRMPSLNLHIYNMNPYTRFREHHGRQNRKDYESQRTRMSALRQDRGVQEISTIQLAKSVQMTTLTGLPVCWGKSPKAFPLDAVDGRATVCWMRDNWTSPGTSDLKLSSPKISPKHIYIQAILNEPSKIYFQKMLTYVKLAKPQQHSPRSSGISEREGRHSGLLSDETLHPMYKMVKLLLLENKTVDFKPYNIFIRNPWQTINYCLHHYTFTSFCSGWALWICNTHFQVMLILLVQGLPFEKHCTKPSNRKKK